MAPTRLITCRTLWRRWSCRSTVLATAFVGRYRLALFEPPYPSPPFEVMSLWHRENGDQPAIAWMRRLLREVAGEL